MPAAPPPLPLALQRPPPGPEPGPGRVAPAFDLGADARRAGYGGAPDRACAGTSGPERAR